MFIKRIVCDVPADQKQHFSNAQQAWIEIQYAKGLIAQIGGWDMDAAEKACIFSFWSSYRYYKQFMDTIHDSIFVKSRQQNTYSSISVNYFEPLSKTVPSKVDLIPAFKKSAFFAYAEGVRFTENSNQFAPGFLTDLPKGPHYLFPPIFVKAEHDPSSFLGFTFWDTVVAHRKDLKDRLLGGVSRGFVETPWQVLQETHIKLEQSWKVIATHK